MKEYNFKYSLYRLHLSAGDFPMEFMVAVINNFGGFYSRELYFYELMKTDANVYPPCVNNCDYLTNIKGKDVHIGFIHIKDLEKGIAERIIEQRRFGKYLHLQDFIERTQISSEQLNILIRIAALRFTGKNKKQLLWEGDFLLKKNKNHVPASKSLFKEPSKSFALPGLPVYPIKFPLWLTKKVSPNFLISLLVKP